MHEILLLIPFTSCEGSGVSVHIMLEPSLLAYIKYGFVCLVCGLMSQSTVMVMLRGSVLKQERGQRSGIDTIKYHT